MTLTRAVLLVALAAIVVDTAAVSGGQMMAGGAMLHAYVNPVVALLIGHELGGEPIGARTIVGGVLAVVLVLYLLLGPRDRANTGFAQRSDAPQTRMTTPSNPTTSEPSAPTTK